MTNSKKYPKEGPPHINAVANTLKEKCFQCVRGPKNILRTGVFIVCFIVVVIQVGQCVAKILQPPITTYSHFDFNRTIQYPAVTFCREPPYKGDKMEEYGMYGHPRYTSNWRNFPFDNVSLEEFWDNITYSQSDYFIQLAYNNLASNLEIIENRGFIYGTCFTVKPRIPSATAGLETGYSIYLNHSIDQADTSTSIKAPGYYLFIHSEDEPFTETIHSTTALMDTLYVFAGEEVRVRLSVSTYTKVHKDDDPCISDPDYSKLECSKRTIWGRVINEVGCTGPWMETNESKIPICNTYNSFRALLSAYIREVETIDNKLEECLRRCKSHMYSAFVIDRQQTTKWDVTSKSWTSRVGREDSDFVQIYLFFNSMLVPVYEELYAYDWSQFIADLGGSAGFLLGLSVIGIIVILENLWDNVIHPAITSKPDGLEKDPNPDGKLPNKLNNENKDIRVVDEALAKKYDKFAYEKNFHG